MVSLQELLDITGDASRRTRSNYHVTLGELVDKLAPLDEDAEVVVDFNDFSPQTHLGYPHSYRGYYSDLSFSPGGDLKKVGQVCQRARDCIDKTFEGWKGGDFTMVEDTPLWISPEGKCWGFAIVDIKEEDGKVVLIAKNVE